VGAIDTGLAAVTVPDGVDIEQIIGDLPLVARHGPWVELHPLWKTHLESTLTEEEVRAARRRAAGAVLQRGDFERAFELMVDAGADDDIRALCVRACRAPHGPVHAKSLARWLHALSPAVRASPEGMLLRGVVQLAERFTDPTTDLEAAMAAFRDESQTAGELACIAHLTHHATEIGAPDRLAALMQRAIELEAAGVIEAIPLACLGRAMTAIVAGDHRGALLELQKASTDVEFTGLLDFYLFQEHFALGECEEALVWARRATRRASASLRPTAWDAVHLSLWHLGRVDEAVTATHEAVRLTRESSAARNGAIIYAHSALTHALLGKVDAARELLAASVEHDPFSQGPYAVMLLRAVKAAIALGAGTEDEAAALLREMVAHSPLDDPVARLGAQAAVAILYMLLPEARQLLDSWDVPPLFDVGRQLARTLVTVRATGSVESVRQLAWPDPLMVLSKVFLPWSVELAVAGLAAGRREAQGLLDILGDDAARFVRSLASGSGVVAATAARLAATIPAVPRVPIELKVLGPMRLIRGASAQSVPLQRERVRTILGYLVINRAASRNALARALWPDLERASAANNLRVNLNHLIRSLEPDKPGQVPSYFIRSEADSLRLAGGDWLVVDLWDFDARLGWAAKAEQAGWTAEALDHLLAAVDLYRGPFLEELDLDWALYERERLRSRFVGAAVRAAELLVSRRNPETAVGIAARAVDADRWSERAHQALIAAYLGLGDRGAAMRTLQGCTVMLTELGTEPDQRTLELERRVARGSG
jgi:DNA-binding SARP family transcriptional activator